MTKKSDKKRNATPKQTEKKPARKKNEAGGKAAVDAAAREGKSEKETNSFKNDEKVLKALIEKGKEQGSLTYDEINKALSNEMMSSEMIDDTLMMFDDMDIEIIEKQDGFPEKDQATEKK